MSKAAASTLFVSPTGESLLFDTGYPDGDRDAKRIFAAAQKAGLTKIDHVVISHWHGDHVGGLEALSKMIPIGKFYDHGDGVEPADKARHDLYVAIAGANRTILKAGDTIRSGVCRCACLVSEGPVIANPVNGGGPNRLCAGAPRQAPAAPENIRMVALSITYNNFKYASLAIPTGRARWILPARSTSSGMSISTPSTAMAGSTIRGRRPPRRDRAAGDRAEQRPAKRPRPEGREPEDHQRQLHAVRDAFVFAPGEAAGHRRRLAGA